MLLSSGGDLLYRSIQKEKGLHLPSFLRASILQQMVLSQIPLPRAHLSLPSAVSLLFLDMSSFVSERNFTQVCIWWRDHEGRGVSSE